MAGVAPAVMAGLSSAGDAIASAAPALGHATMGGLSSLGHLGTSALGALGFGGGSAGGGVASNLLPMAEPGASGAPSIASMASSLPSWINPSQITGVSTTQGNPNPMPGMGNQGWLKMLGQVAPQLLSMAGQGAAAVQPAQPPEMPGPAPIARTGMGSAPAFGPTNFNPIGQFPQTPALQYLRSLGIRLPIGNGAPGAAGGVGAY